MKKLFENDNIRWLIAIAIMLIILGLTMMLTSFKERPVEHTETIIYRTQVIYQQIQPPVQNISYIVFMADAPQEPEPDRTQPIYEVYKNGNPVDAPAEIQWLIRDLADEHGFDEKIIMGMITLESTWNPRSHHINCACHERSDWRGLAQIAPFWLRSKPVEPYRLTEDYRERDLFNPTHNLITLAELISYASDRFDIDISTEYGMTQYLYWHSSGKDPRNIKESGSAYTRLAVRYANELIEVTP